MNNEEKYGKQISTEQAIMLAGNEAWKEMTKDDIVRFQLFQDKLSMPFSVFHEAMEYVFGRSIWSHEFAGIDALIKEYLGEKPVPTFEEICDLIPESKRIIIGL